MSHILLNYASLLFCSIFGEIIRELFFLDIKLTISEKSTKRLRKFVFLTMFERGKILRLIWICLNNRFLINQWKGININKNGFSPQSGPHSAKLCLSVFLSILGYINRELFFLDIKGTLSETWNKTLRKFVFLTMFEGGKSWGEFGFI